MKTVTNKKIVFLLIIIGFLVWGNSLRNTLVWDDDENIINNSYIRHISLWPKLFTENQVAGAGVVSNQYRPILELSYGIEYHIWRLWPVGYHFINIIIHIFNAILIFLILKKIQSAISPSTSLRVNDQQSAIKPFNHLTIPFLTSLLFLIHPIQTEAVDYIAGRTDLLGLMFMLITVYLFLKKLFNNEAMKQWNNLAIYLSFILALLSKESTIILPGIISLLYLMFAGSDRNYLIFAPKGKRATTNTDRKLNSFASDSQSQIIFVRPEQTTIFLLIISLIYFFLRLTVFNFQNTLNFYNSNNLFTTNIFYRFFTFLSTLPVYLSLFIAPIHLFMERTNPVYTSLLYPMPLLGFILISMLVALLILLRKNKLILFSVSWILLTLLPVSNILVPLNSLIAEHWMYIPSVGVFLFVSCFFSFLASKKNFRSLTIFIIVIIVISLSLRTISRNSDWKDRITFYEQTIKFSPGSARVRNNLAMAYADVKQYEKAEKEYLKSISLSDDYPQTHHNLGNIYVQLKRYDQAINEYKKAIKMDKYFSPAYFNLTLAYLRKGEKDRAITTLETYGKLFPGDPKTGELINLIKSDKIVF
ncbi:MAG: hypothetical protein UU37_C0007G0002 [Candidatus Gottesmanbacteria bacterium GW2011_GWA2_41_12]|uniref:Uncharacterized protein n=2 Tax=Candidatus Gottesmaniibacteriota TaxID=1752720 RepID=A0A0G0WV06_9BACT|nr:MAG: hypothetical protein UT63_C0065G0002 [Candidatus Gottesmanbacteria bacterium GW2011_GWC2_39_8]KKR88285.1 MAG: hypothetical protein UU37_C0007G0002 [Candidatus Gottesmanbacteria bacterium GW2011_GWA2_41_12]